MQVAKINLQPSCYLLKGQILAVNGQKLLYDEKVSLIRETTLSNIALS